MKLANDSNSQYSAHFSSSKVPTCAMKGGKARKTKNKMRKYKKRKTLKGGSYTIVPDIKMGPIGHLVESDKSPSLDLISKPVVYNGGDLKNLHGQMGGKKRKTKKGGSLFGSKKEPLKYDFTEEEAKKLESLFCNDRSPDEDQCSPEDIEKSKIIGKIRAQMRLDQFPGTIDDFKKQDEESFRKFVNEGSDIIKREAKDVTGSKLATAAKTGAYGYMRYITGGVKKHTKSKKKSKKAKKVKKTRKTRKTKRVKRKMKGGNPVAFGYGIDSKLNSLAEANPPPIKTYNSCQKDNYVH